MPEKSLDSISDPLPYDKKEERFELMGRMSCREFQDVMDDYREGMSDEQLNVFQMILKGYVSLLSNSQPECILHRRRGNGKELRIEEGGLRPP